MLSVGSSNTSFADLLSFLVQSTIMGNFKMTWLKVVHKSDTSEKRKKSNINEEDLPYFMQWQIL
jgi:hypothetical protein